MMLDVLGEKNLVLGGSLRLMASRNLFCKSQICLCINQICLMVRNPNQTDDVRSNEKEGEEEADEYRMI